MIVFVFSFYVRYFTKKQKYAINKFNKETLLIAYLFTVTRYYLLSIFSYLANGFSVRHHVHRSRVHVRHGLSNLVR